MDDRTPEPSKPDAVKPDVVEPAGVEPDVVGPAVEVPDVVGPAFADSLFSDDPATMDLGVKVDQAWVDFQTALAGALPTLPESVVAMDLTLDPTAAELGDARYTVTIELPEPGKLRAFAVSNRMLPEAHRLSLKRLGEVMALGWSPPGLVAGSDERFGLELPMSESLRAAKIITRTLREVYGSPHPAFLLYVAVSANGGAVQMPALGVARPEEDEGVPQLGHIELASVPLAQRVALVLSAMLKIAPESLPVDADGDIGIRSGSAMVFVRVRDEPPLVEVFSPVLTQVNENQRLYQRLSELTHRMPIGRLYWASNTVWASITVFGRDFQATHLMLAVQVMTGLADELDDRLAGEFGGRRFFSDTPPGQERAPAPGEPPADPRIGQYL